MAIASSGQYPSYLTVAPSYATRMFCVIVVLGVVDDVLVGLAAKRKPRHIVVCLGGGTQERVGLMLKRQCAFPTSIHCIGAAIGFLTGNQVRIPSWADRFFLGWLFRCLSEPAKFVPRYWKACKLVPMMIRYRENPPKLISS